MKNNGASLILRSVPPLAVVRGLPKADPLLEIKGHRWAGPVAMAHPYIPYLPPSVTPAISRFSSLLHLTNLNPQGLRGRFRAG